MRRGAKPGKAKVVAKRPRPRTSPKDEASKRHDLEKRLAAPALSFSHDTRMDPVRSFSP